MPHLVSLPLAVRQTWLDREYVHFIYTRFLPLLIYMHSQWSNESLCTEETRYLCVLKHETERERRRKEKERANPK